MLFVSITQSCKLLFAAGDISGGGTSANQRQKFHTDDANQSSSTRNVPSGEERGETDVSEANKLPATGLCPLLLCHVVVLFVLIVCLIFRDDFSWGS